MPKQPKARGMLTHDQIWTALDRLAERGGLSPSGLARRSGLDPTTFNKSKRIRTAKTLELQSLNPAHVDRTLAVTDVAWIARIVWARQ